MIGRVLLRKIAAEFSQQLHSIIIINIAGKNEAPSRTQGLSELITRDMYFKTIHSRIKPDKISFVTIDISTNSPPPTSELVKVDILFNCHIPQDFTRDTIQSCLDSHVWKSRAICTHLKTLMSIDKIVMVSSLFCQNYGYVS